MSRRLPRAAGVIIAITLTFATACSRAVSVGSGGPTAAAYAVNVTNAAAFDLAVGYDDGAGRRALGLVRAGQSERFIIASPKRTIVTITGATPDGSRTVASVPVELHVETTVHVTLR
jgi:hypothetical protein